MEKRRKEKEEVEAEAKAKASSSKSRGTKDIVTERDYSMPLPRVAGCFYSDFQGLKEHFCTIEQLLRSQYTTSKPTYKKHTRI